MALNFVRGFRRIGWTLTVPLAAFVLLLFYDQTKEIFKYEYKEVEREAYSWEKTVEISSIGGTAYFPIETNEETIRKVVAEIEEENKSILEPRRIGFDLRPVDPYEITPQEKVNTLKFAGLALFSFAGVAIFIQGSISILAWILKGFKG